MPTVLTMEIPKPTDPAEFEKIVSEAMQLKWETPRLQRNGRPGQQQDGVDIHGTDDLERSVVIQCKRTVVVPSMKLINDEIAKAEKFLPIPSTMYIATTADPDVHLQKQLRVLSAERVSAGKFAVGILFWEDVVSGLMRNAEVLAAIYPQLDVAPLRQRVDFSRAALALELGFHGGNLRGFAQLILGELGGMANEDPDQILVMTSLIKTAAQRLLPHEYSDPIREAADEVSGEVRNGMTGGVADWRIIASASERTSRRVDQSSSLLSTFDEQALRVGRLLGSVYLSVDEPTSTLLDRIEAEMRPLLSESGRGELPRGTEFRFAGALPSRHVQVHGSSTDALGTATRTEAIDRIGRDGAYRVRNTVLFRVAPVRPSNSVPPPILSRKFDTTMNDQILPLFQ